MYANSKINLNLKKKTCLQKQFKTQTCGFSAHLKNFLFKEICAKLSFYTVTTERETCLYDNRLPSFFFFTGQNSFQGDHRRTRYKTKFSILK
jgi:hypothetical protein